MRILFKLVAKLDIEITEEQEQKFTFAADKCGASSVTDRGGEPKCKVVGGICDDQVVHEAVVKTHQGGAILTAIFSEVKDEAGFPAAVQEHFPEEEFELQRVELEY